MDFDPDYAARQSRRLQKRARTRRARLVLGGLAALVLLAAAVVAMGSGGDPSPRARQVSTHNPPAPPKIVPGGPLAPARFGGLAALWAPGNVVAPQPGSAAAYLAASRRAGLPGYLLIADRGNNRILVVDPGRRIVFRYPSAADLAAGRKLVYNDDTFVEPGGRALIANEENNQAIVEVGISDHRLRVLFGEPGRIGGGPKQLNTPDDAYALPDGSFTVADAYNCRILFIKNQRIIRQIGRSGSCSHDPPRRLGAVNGDTPVPGGGVLISEITGSWIDEISASGHVNFAFQAPVSYPSDPQPLPGRRILLADYASPGHVLILDRHGHVLWRYGPTGGYGRLDHPSLAMGLPNGDIAVNDDFRQRVVVIDPRTKKIVWQYGHTDRTGTAPGFLNTPDGMDFVPAGADGRPDFAAVVHP